MKHKYCDIEGKGKTITEIDDIEWYQDIFEDLNEYSISGLVVDDEGGRVHALYFTENCDPTDKDAIYYQFI